MPRLIIKATIAGMIWLAAFPSIAQQEVDRCRTVAELLGRDESQSIYSLKLAEELHTNICNGKQVKSGFDLSGNASFVVDMIPMSIGGTFSGRKEKAEHFCSTHDSSKSTDIYQSGSSSLVVRQAIDAWLQCAVLNRDVFINIKPTQSAASFFFDVKRGVEDSTFKGIKVTEGSLSCTSSFRNGSEHIKTQDVNRDTVVETSPSTLSVACTRSPEKTSDGFSYLPQTAFLIDTSRGSMPVVLPRDAHLGPVYASELASQIAQLRAEINASELKLLKRTIQFHRECTQGIQQMQNITSPACPATFSQAFKDVFSYSGGPQGLGQHCTVCFKIVDGN